MQITEEMLLRIKCSENESRVPRSRKQENLTKHTAWSPQSAELTFIL